MPEFHHGLLTLEWVAELAPISLYKRRADYCRKRPPSIRWTSRNSLHERPDSPGRAGPDYPLLSTEALNAQTRCRHQARCRTDVDHTDPVCGSCLCTVPGNSAREPTEGRREGSTNLAGRERRGSRTPSQDGGAT